MTFRRCLPRTLGGLTLLGLLFVPPLAGGQTTAAGREAEAAALDHKVMAEVKGHAEIMANLTYLCDTIGPRLTGSKNLKRANEWVAEKMTAYGLSDVHQEPWTLPEGWERGTASARLVEPDTGIRLNIASMAWSPGTKGKVEGDVVVLTGATAKDLEQYKGKLKNAIILMQPPARMVSLADIDKPMGRVGSAEAPGAPGKPFQQPAPGEGRGGRGRGGFGGELMPFLEKEGAAVILSDSGKPLGLLNMGGGLGMGGMGGRGGAPGGENKPATDRPSAANRIPRAFVSHDHYAMLYRLATRPAPARTRVEIEINNTFVPGPVVVNNTVGEIRGSDKPDEAVIVGAHLDSWDLGQGATDNGTGSVTVLEAARALVKSGVKPRRTIRFVLFTGEEQGLLGSRAYVQKHKDEMPRISAAIVHDTGTGKVVGVDARHRPILQPLLAKELVSLKDVGVTTFDTAFIGGSDHASFDRAGPPGLMFRQEVAGYRLNHHSQADTLDRALEPDLLQGAQAMAVTALRIANLDELLPRERPPQQFAGGGQPGQPAKPEAKVAGRFDLDALGKVVGVSEPQLSPDGRSVVVITSRPDYEKDRSATELVLVDVAGGRQRVLTHERDGISQPRWSPDGDRLAFLARVDGKPQVFIMPMNGGDAKRVTNSPTGVRQFAWKPDGSAIAYAAPDEAPKKGKNDDAFEVGDDGYLVSAAPVPTHVWLVQADGSNAKRLTSGPWSLEVSQPPAPPLSPLSWSPDGNSIALIVQERPNIGDGDRRTVRILDVATGQVRALTGRKQYEHSAVFSPEGSQVAYRTPRDGDPMNVGEIWVAPLSGGEGACLTRPLDRNVVSAVWSPDGKGLLVAAHDGTHVSLWMQPVAGEAKHLDLGGRVCPTGTDVQFGRDGALVFTASEPGRPAEVYYMASVNATPRRLTDLNAETAGRALGKVEAITWETHDKFKADGVLTYPPDFDAQKKYPLVLLIHGGPMSASVERFNAWAQLIAAKGFVVFEPNYRGSDNLGNAYQRAIFKDQGDGPGKDVMAGLEEVKKRGFVDEKKIAVTGWSYGGYMTTWLIGHYHVWKTAIAGAAVTDLIDQYNLSDGNVARRAIYGGSPWAGDDLNRYREQSPITYAKDVKTPTLIIATTGDARVTVTQSYKFYHALKDNNVPVKFVAYPVPGHFPGDPTRQKDVYRRWVAWLDEQLR
jgi:dipeptidyl aminopeptidase/acylaminoacyl peptidase